MGRGGSWRVVEGRRGSGRLVRAFFLCSPPLGPCRRILENLWDPWVIAAALGRCEPPGHFSAIFQRIVVPIIAQLSIIYVVSKLLHFPLQLQISKRVRIRRT